MTALSKFDFAKIRYFFEYSATCCCFFMFLTLFYIAPPLVCAQFYKLFDMEQFVVEIG